MTARMQRWATPAARFDVAGVKVSAVNLERAVGLIVARLRERRARVAADYICIRDSHGIVQSWRDRSLRDIHNRAFMVTPDGMPLVWLGRASGHADVGRVYGPDLMLELCGRAADGLRHYFYGGAENVADLLATRLTARFPGLQVVGTCTPPFRPLTDDETSAVVDRINACKPDIVWVGLGTPKQERWMADNRAALDAPLLIGVGAAFDFHSGRKRQAPRWMQRGGLEWLFRLWQEPRRLGPRYLVGNPIFIALVLRDWLVRRGRFGITPAADEGRPS